MPEPTTDVVPLTESEREALWQVWESDVLDDADLAGLFFAAVVLIAADRVAAARVDERRLAWEWFRDLLDAHLLKGQPVYDEFMSDWTDLEADHG